MIIVHHAQINGNADISWVNTRGQCIVFRIRLGTYFSSIIGFTISRLLFFLVALAFLCSIRFSVNSIKYVISGYFTVMFHFIGDNATETHGYFSFTPPPHSSSSFSSSSSSLYFFTFFSTFFFSSYSVVIFFSSPSSFLYSPSPSYYSPPPPLHSTMCGVFSDCNNDSKKFLILCCTFHLP